MVDHPRLEFWGGHIARGVDQQEMIAHVLHLGVGGWREGTSLGNDLQSSTILIPEGYIAQRLKTCHM